MICVFNGILLSHKKEHIWVSSNGLDEPRAYYAEWCKSEGEIWTSYTNAHIWNLEMWFWLIDLQDRNGEADIENIHRDTRRGDGEMYGDSKMETYNTICKIDS